MALGAAADGSPVFTLGEVVHNREVIGQLARQGIKSVDRLDQVEKGTLVIRTHGVPPAVLEEARSLGLNVIDATCPWVAKAQRLTRSLIEEGYELVILGVLPHPEVIGLQAYAEQKAYLVNSPEEWSQLPRFNRVGLISQTTQSPAKFQELAAFLALRSNELKAYNTICPVTVERQQAAARLAGEVDLMLVVGGKNSANTRELASIAQLQGTTTYQIENANEIQEEWFEGVHRVGITGGTSTPDESLEEVRLRIEKIALAGQRKGSK